MVCSLGNANMTAFARLQAIGSASQTVTDEVCHQKLAAKCSRRDFREADEDNLIDEEDMHIYGLRPMTDPLVLVCCNTCKKPIKASQYTVHEELCKSIYSKIIPEPNVPAPKKKPPPKERKKAINHANQATSHRDLKKDDSIDTGKINALESSAKGKIQSILHAEHNRNANPNAPHIMNGSRVGSYNMECSGNATLRPSEPFKRVAAVSPTNQVNGSMCVTEAKILPCSEGLCVTMAKALPYVPKPMATKIYYSQRNQDLRRAICHMFYDDSGHVASRVELERVNSLPIQTSSPVNPYLDQDMNQQGGDKFLHRAKNPDQILASGSELGGFVSSVNLASQIPVNNNLGPHFMSNPYSIADKEGNPLNAV